MRSVVFQLLTAALLISPCLEVGGCAFGDVTGYEIASCDPNAADATTDICNRLNAGLAPTECSVWQCDKTTARCVRSTKDADHDGDPSPACGGHDCNDQNAAISSKAKETCNGIDDNCDGNIDEGLFGIRATTELFRVEQATTASDPAILGPSGGEALVVGDAASIPNAVFVGGTGTGSGRCLKTGPMTKHDPPAGCAFLGDESDLVPHQPSVRSFGVGLGTMFVSTKLCPDGALQYRFAVSGQTTLSIGGTCDSFPATKGAALPNFEYFRDGTLAAAVFYGERVPDLSSSASCDAIAKAPAPLYAVAIQQPTTSPSYALGPALPLTLSNGASSRARPALARIDVDAPNQGGILVASPDGAGASLWVLGGGTGLTEWGATALANMNDARSTALGVAKTADGFHVAVAADIGCTAQAIRVAFGTLSATAAAAPTVAMTAAVDVATGAGARFSPIVRWVTPPATAADKTPFWLVGWIEAGGQIVVRRYAADGHALGDAIPLVTGASIIDASSDGTVLVFAPAASNNASAFESVSLGCGSN